MIFKHKVNQEEFNKLPQLDRIEFRQKQDYLEKYYDSNLGSWHFLNQMFTFMGFLIIIALLVYNINPKYIINIFSVLILLIKLTIVCFIILITAELIISFKRIKEKRKLQDEYFKVEVKSKK